MSIAIITDSTCDLDSDAESVYDIDIIPLLVTIDGKTFRDGVDISREEFFAHLSKAKTLLPSTSQPSPAMFQDVFRRRLDEGRHVIGVFFSSALSGTYQSAVMARSLFSAEEQKKITVIDSKQGTGCLGLLVIEACKMRDSGADAATVIKHINALIPRIKLYAVLDTLKYLKMGGRLSGAAVTFSSILHIVPVLTLVNGTITVAAKIRKSPKAFSKWLHTKLSSEMPDPHFPTMLIHGNNVSLATMLKEEFKSLFPRVTINICLGAVIGTHVGANAYGIAYIPLEK
ncbi:MAG: DegV family protein [Dehalococcoidia bacterium]|nr:DegV family protein [Dehalococcoidia bacterium]